MPQYRNAVIEVSTTDDFETEVSKLLSQSAASYASGGDGATEFVASLPKKLTDSTFADILADYGAGRISKGLQGLELLSIMCSGTTTSNLFLFDNVIYTGSVYEFKSGTDAKLIQLVTDNLGMTFIISQLSTSATESYKAKCLTIAKQVKNGKFVADSVRKSMIIQSKKLVNYYLGKT